ncbi:uncharacterized protein LY79DRAFT_371547 [Colletotrichum navitas]|uniref:Uncharacterized protein n=1 Tax=Colletotrichum navitas TaxID=681940 RepID=A0AAD8PPX7_9PEZI|nr:uncharacterized protein LY79DRAFT_371547 [Colletotrichum navitas]KAK1574254.1 hypothetical protein LY79DRAFT_371547 [Colletotrichum navitas]
MLLVGKATSIWQRMQYPGRSELTPLIAVLLSRLSPYILNSYQHHPFGDEPVKRCGGVREGGTAVASTIPSPQVLGPSNHWLVPTNSILHTHTRAKSGRDENSSYRHPTYDTKRVFFHRTPKSACTHAIVIGPPRQQNVVYRKRKQNRKGTGKRHSVKSRASEEIF